MNQRQIEIGILQPHAVGPNARYAAIRPLIRGVRKHVRSTPLLLSRILAPHESIASAAEVCPTLPKDTYLEWTHQQGPDLTVCHAVHPATKRTYLEIYMGMHPDFNPEDAVKNCRREFGNQENSLVSNENGQKTYDLPKLENDRLIKSRKSRWLFERA